MAPSTTSWSEWITELARVPGDTYNALMGSDYRFPTDQGLIIVHEEGPLAHLGATVRARCTTSGREYDLRRLRAGANAGGLVALEALEALEREASLSMKAGVHSHTLRFRASLIENTGGTHCRLLLCDPCSADLRAYLSMRSDKLPASEVAELGQQLAFGLGHLHNVNILYGSMTPTGVVLGRDGLWKLADFNRSAELPLTAAEWQSQCAGSGQPLEKVDEIPPEARGSSSTDMWPEADVWLLGHLLAVLLLNEANGDVAPGVEKGSTMLAATIAALEEPLVARFWLLLHWLLAVEPADRPNANETAALVSTVAQAHPQEMLEEMPPAARCHCGNVALAAARQLAVDEAVAAAAGAAEHGRLVRRLSGLPLAELRRELADTSRVDRLCGNCGIELDEDERVGQLCQE